jgi:hypothetical protein
MGLPFAALLSEAAREGQRAAFVALRVQSIAAQPGAC